MGVEISEMAVKLRIFVILMLRKSYTSVCNHPFLVCMLLFLVFLYRSSPFLFSLLVSASPVLVCTAVLLGILLSFGQPNIPEIEKDEKFMNETGSLRTGIRTDTVVEKSEEFSVERVTHKNLEIKEHSNDDVNLVANTSRELDRSDSLDSSFSSIKEGSHEIELDKKDGEDDEHEFEMDKSPAESFDSERVNVDSLDSPPNSPWKHVEERVEGDEAEEDDYDDESDQAESSSPDASMADIIPLLDELHPLLDDDHPPQPIPLSHDGSDAASERSNESSDSVSDDDDDDNNNIDKDEDLEEGKDEEDEEEEEEQYNKKESETKVAITWTEEDQKNLMDLGSSELERNQRLESLIARRRAKKSMSMMPERNLIDFDSTDLPFNIAPISTSRNNPFEIGHDSYGNNNIGLPPIPGSAPSILLPRRNPFDIPYDSSEEKPNLTGDSFQQEFSSSQQKETFFRRRESFNVGPSVFGPNRFKPVFVPERSYIEESSYSTFQRQSSGLSDSKASSVPETDSVVSTGDIEENNNLILEDNVTQNEETLNFVPEIELKSQTGNLETNNSFGGEDISEALVEEEPLMTVENSNHGDEEFTQETKVIVKMEDVSEHVGHGSQSSEEDDDDDDDSENDDQLSVLNALHESNTNKESGLVVGDTHHKEPIYDTSPTSISKNASSSSTILSEIKEEESDIMEFQPASLTEMESEKLEGPTDTKEKKTEIYTSKVDLDRSMDETPSIDQHGVQQEPLVMEEEISDESKSLRESLNLSDVLDVETVPTNINILSDAYESRAVECFSDDEHENDLDYVEEIGEDLLSELDTVGDFSVKNLDSELHVPESSSYDHDDLETISAKENETDMVESKVDFEMPLIEAQSLEDIKSVFKKSETSTMVDNSEVLLQEGYEMPVNDEARKTNNIQNNGLNSSDTMTHEGQSTETLPESGLDNNEAGGVNDEQSNEKESVSQESTNGGDVKSDAKAAENAIITDVNLDAKIAVTQGSAVLRDEDNVKHSNKLKSSSSSSSDSSSSDSDNESK